MFRWGEEASWRLPISTKWMLRLILIAAIITNILTLIIVLD